MRSKTKIRIALNEFGREFKDWISYLQLADYIETRGVNVSLQSMYNILREYNIERRIVRIKGLRFTEIKFRWNVKTSG